jgi:hypothetical protein
MLISVAVDPKSFDRELFANPSYRDHAEIFFRGLESNGLLLVDSEEKLLDELDNRLSDLGTKSGQQLQIRFAELRKRRRRRLVVVDSRVCDTQHCAGAHNVACKIRSKCGGDSVILDEATFEEYRSREIPTQFFTPLSGYISSKIELERRRFMEQLPFIDQLHPGEFDSLMVRALRFTRVLRFYDKQIAKGESLGRFKDGIRKILELWTGDAHFPRSTLKAELYTCEQRTHAAESDVHQRVLASITRPLATDFNLQFTLFWKRDSDRLSHDRYLQTENVPISFSRGFDFVEGGELQRCKIQVDNGAEDHLTEYRNLADVRPPT